MHAPQWREASLPNSLYEDEEDEYDEDEGGALEPLRASPEQLDFRQQLLDMDAQVAQFCGALVGRVLPLPAPLSPPPAAC